MYNIKRPVSRPFFIDFDKKHMLTKRPIKKMGGALDLRDIGDKYIKFYLHFKG